MKISKSIRESGFSLVELIVAVALGLTLTIVGATALNKVQDLSYLIAQRSEMQQNARSAFNYLATDISLAGTGIPVGGVTLPLNLPSPPTMGGLFSTCCNSFDPDSTGQQVLYSAEGGWSSPTYTHLGPDFKPKPLITMSYIDAAVSTLGGVSATACLQPPMVLDQIWAIPNPPGSATITDVPNGVKIAFNPCIDITNPADPLNAVKIGDVLLVCDPACAVGMVTDLPGGNAVLLKKGDPLNFNQQNTATGNSTIQDMKVLNPLGVLAYQSGATATRIKVVTYYLNADAGRDGLPGTYDDGPPFRLMRRENAGNPVLLAENILDLQVSYDWFDTGDQKANQQDMTLLKPAIVRNVNLFINLRSPTPNGRGTYQYQTLSTSVAPRNLSYHDRYK